MYTEHDKNRRVEISEGNYRSAFRRDYARLVHSPAFRRLQGKTQLYPGAESDFFRNRLTHSIEVAQIAKSIALKLNFEVLADREFKIDPDLCEFAGLAHDLGHPPFGHQGEDALDECMAEYGGFEGNAQTLRILAVLEKRLEFDANNTEDRSTNRIGLNPTFRSLAAILKYDNVIPMTLAERNQYEKWAISEDENETLFLAHFEKREPIKGYYKCEEEIVQAIKRNVAPRLQGKFKSIECRIMDVADDIAYSTYDLEDGMKAGFFHPTSVMTHSKQVYKNVAEKVRKSPGLEYFTEDDVLQTLYEIFEEVYKSVLKGKDENAEENSGSSSSINYLRELNSISIAYASNGELRNELTSKLVNNAIEGIVLEINEDNLSQSVVRLNTDVLKGVEVLKHFNYESQILSPRMKVAEYRGKEIVKKIFEALSQNEGWRLLPADFQSIYLSTEDDIVKMRCICDFVAGMTDKYAIEFYGRLTSEKPETIFKPF